MTSKWYGLLVAISYGVISISITFFNKAVFEVYQFHASSTLTLGQILFSLVFLSTMKKMKLIHYDDFDMNIGMKLLPLMVSFSGMVVTGLAALRFVNVPMYSALRRLTTFIVIAWEYALLGKTVSSVELSSVVAMVVGALVASWGDLELNFTGYFWTAINCAITAWYLVLINAKKAETGLDMFGLMFYNNVQSIPIILALVVLTEWEVLLAFTKWTDPGFILCFFMSSALAILLNYFVFLCTTVNSALATSITGQLKSIVSTLLGLVMFGGVIITLELAIGLSMSTFGGVWYGVIKYQEVQKKDSFKKPDIEEGGEEEEMVVKNEGHEKVWKA